MSTLSNQDQNDFSLYDIAKMLKSSVKILLHYKWVILSTLILFIGLAIFYVKTKTPDYVAVSTLMLDQENNGGNSLFSGLTQKLTLGGGGGGLTENKLIPIAKSRVVQEKVLFKTVNIDGRNDLMINHLFGLEFFYHEFYHKLTEKDLHSSYRDSLVKYMYGNILERFLTIEASTEGIITVKTKCPHEKLSKLYNDILLESVTEYFVDKTTTKEKASLKLVQKRVDSTKSVLNQKQEQLALIKDSRKRMIKAQGYIDEVRLEREITFLSTMYSEALKNLEVSKFNLELKKPVITVIDSAKFPLGKSRPNLILFLIGAVFIGVFMSVGIILMIRFYVKFYKKV